MKWQRIEDGYQSGRTSILDNGNGVGPAKGGGRWAIVIEAVASKHRHAGRSQGLRRRRAP